MFGGINTKLSRVLVVGRWCCFVSAVVVVVVAAFVVDFSLQASAWILTNGNSMFDPHTSSLKPAY